MRSGGAVMVGRLSRDVKSWARPFSISLQGWVPHEGEELLSSNCETLGEAHQKPAKVRDLGVLTF